MPLGEYRVTFVTKGGFAGLPRVHEADSRRLPEEDAATLRSLIEASGLDGGDPDVVSPRAPAGRDLITWDITVEGPSGTHRLSVREDALGPNLDRLLEFVRG